MFDVILKGSLVNKMVSFKLSFSLSDDSDPDMILFLLEIDFSRLKLWSNFVVKLTGLATDQCWVLALHLGLEKSTTTNSIPTRFNLQEMNRILEGGSGDAKLSDKAREFKQLFETFQKTQPASLIGPFFSPPIVGPHLESLMTSNQSKLIMSEITNQSVTAETSSESPLTKQSCDSCVTELKLIEERLTKKIEDFQKVQNEKLDRILFLLESSTLNKS